MIKSSENNKVATKSNKIQNGSWVDESVKIKKVIRSQKIWIKTPSTVSDSDIRSWSSNWSIVKDSLEIIHMHKKPNFSSFCVTFKSSEQIWRRYIPQGIKYEMYKGIHKPKSYTERAPIRHLFLKNIALNVESTDITNAIAIAFPNIDSNKTKLEFIDAKTSNNKVASYKNAYCKIIGKEHSATLCQSSILPCNVFVWKGKLPNFTSKNSIKSPFDSAKWSTYSKDTTSDFKNCVKAITSNSNEIWI